MGALSNHSVRSGRAGCLSSLRIEHQLEGELEPSVQTPHIVVGVEPSEQRAVRIKFIILIGVVERLLDRILIHGMKSKNTGLGILGTAGRPSSNLSY